MKSPVLSILLSLFLTFANSFTAAADEVTDVINEVAAKLVQQLLGVLPRRAVHSEKRQVRDVLQRDVDVLGDLRNVRDRVNQLL